jgi:regulator of extracellular matrix RemA (YlzA/DUF370 family)
MHRTEQKPPDSRPLRRHKRDARSRRPLREANAGRGARSAKVKKSATTLLGCRLRRAVDRRIGVQHASGIGQSRASIERDSDTKRLSYFFAGRPGLDGAVGVHPDAPIATCGDGDSDGDEFAGLGVKTGSSCWLPCRAQ